MVSKDNVRLGVRVQVYFTLNRNKDVLKSFHERIGLKTEAYEDERLERHAAELLPAADRPGAGRGRDQLRLGRALQQRDEEVGVPVRARPRSSPGCCRPPSAATTSAARAYNGNNDCGELSFTIQKPTPLDKGIIDGLEAKQRAELAKATQEQKNQQVNVELQSVKQQVAMLGAQGYLLKTAIESGKIQFMVIPQNGNVSIPVPTTDQTTSRPPQPTSRPLTHDRAAVPPRACAGRRPAQAGRRGPGARLRQHPVRLDHPWPGPDRVADVVRGLPDLELVRRPVAAGDRVPADRAGRRQADRGGTAAAHDPGVPRRAVRRPDRAGDRWSASRQRPG